MSKKKQRGRRTRTRNERYAYFRAPKSEVYTEHVFFDNGRQLFGKAIFCSQTDAADFVELMNAAPDAEGRQAVLGLWLTEIAEKFGLNRSENRESGIPTTGETMQNENESQASEGAAAGSEQGSYGSSQTEASSERSSALSENQSRSIDDVTEQSAGNRESSAAADRDPVAGQASSETEREPTADAAANEATPEDTQQAQAGGSDRF